MPYAYALKRTPQGHEYVEAIASGTVDLASASDFNARFAKGGVYAGKPLLSVLAEGTSFTVDGRKAIISGHNEMAQIAVVVTSAALRVMLNFMVKASAAAAAVTATAQPASNMRTFTKVEDAVAWLDEDLSKPAS